MTTRFPHNWKVTKSDDSIIIRDQLLGTGKGYWIEVEQTMSGYRATLKFEDYAKGIFGYAEEQINNCFKPIRPIFHSNPNLSLRLHRKTVEGVFETGIVQDGLWVELELRDRKKEPDNSLFVDALISIITYLIPYQVVGNKEGENESFTGNKFERSLSNRSTCLAFHGYRCKSCGINMTDIYGDAAQNFIHVHHLHPLADGSIIPDPVRDMVPLCPNCHAVAHLKSPPYTIEEIIEMIDHHRN